MTCDVIFDFDGVIADTRDLLFDAFRAYDPTISEEDFLAHFDGNVYETPRVRFTPEGAAQLHGTYCRNLRARHVEAAIGPIGQLAARHRLFIISSGDERGILGALGQAGLGGAFHAIYGHNTHRSKVTKFRMIRDAFDVSLESAVFVTDTLGDIWEARTLNITTIAETFGFHDRGRLEQGEPHVIVDSWDEVVAEISRADADHRRGAL